MCRQFSSVSLRTTRLAEDDVLVCLKTTRHVRNPIPMPTHSHHSPSVQSYEIQRWRREIEILLPNFILRRDRHLGVYE